MASMRVTTITAEIARCHAYLDEEEEDETMAEIAREKIQDLKYAQQEEKLDQIILDLKAKEQDTSSSRSPTTTRLGFNTTPAVLPSQKENKVVPLSKTSIILRSASAPCRVVTQPLLDWSWLHNMTSSKEGEEKAAPPSNSSRSTSSGRMSTLYEKGWVFVCARQTNTNKEHIVTVNLLAMPSIFVQPELIPKEYKDKKGITKQRGDLENHWLIIYAFLVPSYQDRLELRCMCRLFHEVEKILTLNNHRYEMLLTPMPLFTTFPHPKYPTLNGLMDKLNEMYVKLCGGVIQIQKTWGNYTTTFQTQTLWVKCTSLTMLSVGTKVRAKYTHERQMARNESFEIATITEVNDDDTVDVAFDCCGVTENDHIAMDCCTGDIIKVNGIAVPLNEIQIKNVR
jgi:hypothetical protein